MSVRPYVYVIKASQARASAPLALELEMVDELPLQVLGIRLESSAGAV